MRPNSDNVILTWRCPNKSNKNTGLKQREDVRTEQAVGLTMCIQVRGEKAPQEQCQCQN